MQQQLTSVRSDLNNVTQLLHILMRENPALATSTHPEEVPSPCMMSAVPDMLSAPLAPVSGTTQVLRQQQQLIANLSHSFNELLSQQGELVQRFSQLERWLAAGAIGNQNRHSADFTFDPTWDNSSAASTLHGGPLPVGSPMGRGRQWAPPGCASYDAVSPWSQPFDFQQRTTPGKAVPLKSPLQQHRMGEAPLSRGASTKELPFPIVSGDSGGTTWRTGAVTGTRSRGLQTSFDGRAATTTELLASRDSIEVIKSSPALSSDRHRKFPDHSEPSIKFCEVPMAGGATADSDGESDVESICIETIQAADTKEEIPRLDLSEVGVRSRRSRTTPQAGSSQVGGTGFNGEAVVGHQFTTARRAGAAAKLASQLGKGQSRSTRHEQQNGKTQNGEGSQAAASALRGCGFFPGLSSGISGTAFLDATSNSSRRSSVQSSMAGDTDQLEASLRRVRAINNPTLNSDVESDAPPSEFSLFEALRETIYSEVATLISQNENRPHFLIELFRELQLLTSDYLRQRALYAVQDLVTQYLAEGHKDGPEEKKVREVRKKDMPWSTQPLGRHLSDLTPSESIATSDDEEVKAHVYAQRAQSIIKREQKAQQLAALQPVSADGWRPSPHGCRFDYLENVEMTSSQSTPSTSSSHLESPFARESLGDTVIHMDKTLQSMREHERKLLEGDCRSSESPRMAKSLPTDTSGMASLCHHDDDRSDVGSSSAQDQGSEGSTSDVTYPRIDTQQLDGEIKAIMLGVLPVLQEHMDDVCSQQLLEYVRQLVLSLTKPKGDNLEFLQFFNNQLNTILADSLAKFDGRKMRECGEDLLGELSEILFNELAFFRLMEDLNSTKSKVKATLQQWRHQESQTSSDAGATAGERQCVNDVLSDASSSSSSSSDSAEDWQSEESERSGVEKGSKEMKRGKEVTEEEEDLGKQARDDAFAAEVDIDEKEDEEKDTDTLQTSSVNFQLVPSELKPYTRIGSDEDDEGDDNEVASADDPSETAVSRDAEKDRINDSDDDSDTTLSRASGNINNHSCSESERTNDNEDEGKEDEEWEDVGEEPKDLRTPNGITTPPEESSTEKSCGDVESVELADGDVTAEEPAVTPPGGASGSIEKATDAAEDKVGDAPSTKDTAASGEGDIVTPEGATGTPSVQPVNGKHVDGQLENGSAADEEVTLDDLPPKLLLIVKDGSSISPDVPLDTQAIVDMIVPPGGELAGSSDTVREPASVPPNGTVKQNGTG